MDINKLTQLVHENAKENGWWDEPRTFGEIIALIHSEASEALEEHRNGHMPNETYYSHTDKHPSVVGKSICDMDISKDIIILCQYSCTISTKIIFEADRYTMNKPEGIPTELADIVIRVMDYCGHEGIDLEKAILEKHEYNKTRPFKHGGKKI